MRCGVKRKLAIAALAFGAAAGFAGGFASMCCHHRWRQQHFKSYVTDVCADAVRQAQVSK
jgi:uncharacterized membrane protein YsdA (DUF1294 family)